MGASKDRQRGVAITESQTIIKRIELNRTSILQRKNTIIGFDSSKHIPDFHILILIIKQKHF